jgi:hypothetical protein
LTDSRAGTGTVRPQSGHLPCDGIGVLAMTLSRRPQGQKNRTNPSGFGLPESGT